VRLSMQRRKNDRGSTTTTVISEDPICNRREGKERLETLLLAPKETPCYRKKNRQMITVGGRWEELSVPRFVTHKRQHLGAEKRKKNSRTTSSGEKTGGRPPSIVSGNCVPDKKWPPPGQREGRGAANVRLTKKGSTSFKDAKPMTKKKE